MRLFYAVTFDRLAQSELVRYQELLRAEMFRGRLVHQDNLHLTLDFIGEVEDRAKIERLKQLLPRLPQLPERISLTGFGRFKQGLVWARVVEDSSLTDLQSHLRTSLINLGFHIETREYRPHITLGRNLRLRVPVSKLEPLEMQLVPRAVALMQSTRIHGRLVYRPIANTP